jgi:hypothetical protein
MVQTTGCGYFLSWVVGPKKIITEYGDSYECQSKTIGMGQDNTFSACFDHCGRMQLPGTRINIIFNKHTDEQSPNPGYLALSIHHA